MTTELTVLAAILGFAIATMPVYRLTGAWAEPDPLESAVRGKFILGNFVRSWFYWFIRPIERLSLAIGLSPLFYNIGGVVLASAGGVAFAFGNMSLGGWGVLAGGAADVLDGRIARARGIASEQGAFLDSTLDRFAEVGAFVGIALWFRTDPVALAAVVIGMGGSLLVSYARARGESVGVLCKLGVLQRAERLLLLGFGGLFDPAVGAWLGRTEPGAVMVPVLWVIAVGTVGTAIFRTYWIARELGKS